MRTLKILIGMSIVSLFAMPLQAQDNKAEYLLIVNIHERRIILYERNRDENKEFRSYPIAVPKNDWLPLPLVGKVKRIELNPFWYPTKKTRIAYLEKKGVELLPIIKPGDPKNAMGKAKIIVQFENFGEPIRIHGTNEPGSIGKRVSRGCIRIRNSQILELVEIIKNSKTKVIIK